MAKKLVEVQGIGENYAKKLEGGGIASQEDLLEQGAKPAGRKKIAEDCDISPKLVLNWVNRADLARVKGIGEEYADLLEFSGVDTVPELAQRKAENLHAKMKEVNEERKLVRSLPSEKQVTDWVAEAKELPRAVHYS